jgi:hypothetical protein
LVALFIFDASLREWLKSFDGKRLENYQILAVVPWFTLIPLGIYSSSRIAKRRIEKWLDSQNLKLVRFIRYWWWEGSPWSNNSNSFISGSSESQTTYRLEVKDQNGNVQKGSVLWGGYFGMSYFTGKIPV